MQDYLSKARSRSEVRVVTSEEEVRAHAVVEGVSTFAEIRHDDMTGAIEVQDGDGVWYGVKGMKWGVTTKSDKAKGGGSAPREGGKSGGSGGSPTLSAASRAKKVPAASSKPAPKADDKKDDKKPEGAKKDQPTGESSIMRYARVSAAARAGNLKGLSNEDIAFFNARTKALDEVNKRFVKQPSQFKQMRSAVFQAALQRSMQGITDHIMDEFIAKPVKKSITDAAAKQAQKRAAAALLRAGSSAAT